jgi:hypothetical protein
MCDGDHRRGRGRLIGRELRGRREKALKRRFRVSGGALLHSRDNQRQALAFVDLVQLGYYTLSENAAVTMWNSEDQEFHPGRWYRSAPWLDEDNSPGVSIVIGDTGSWPNQPGEAVWIDEDGKVNIALTVVNVGSGTAAVGFQWLSSPQLEE